MTMISPSFRAQARQRRPGRSIDPLFRHIGFPVVKQHLQNMRKRKAVPLLSSMRAVLATLAVVFLPTALSKHDAAAEIGQVLGRDGGHVCSECAAAISCPVTCFRVDPVCGVNGITYWCGCPDAMCHGVQVSKLGVCQVGNGSPPSVAGQALLLIHTVWLILVGISLLCGFI